MALHNLARMQTTTTGTGTVTLTSLSGWNTFADSGVTNSEEVTYAIHDANGGKEVGVGTYSTTGPTLSRDTILESTNSDAALNLSGSAEVFVTAVAERIVEAAATQTLTNKTLTTPTITLKQSASPAPTAEGDIQWDTDGDFITVGDGASTQYFYSAIDEDDMSSDSATRVPTQQSVKAYADSIGLDNLTINIQVFTATGTYTPTSGMVMCIVEAVGGGGGGGGSTGNASYLTSGGGGGGGEYSRSVFTAAEIGASKAVAIGAGGSGVSAGSGGAGGTTSFGSTLLTAVGGSGGTAGSSGAFGAPGAGGTGGTGDFTVRGQQTLYGPYNSGSSGFVPAGSPGGNSHLGPGARSAAASTGTTAAGVDAAANTGGGGSGSMSNYAATNRAGGEGGSGILIVTEFIA